jgi:hypothetical protein
LYFLTLVQQLTGSAIASLGQISVPTSSLPYFGFAVAIFQSSKNKGDFYNILWALVFGFATLNILSLVARRFEPHQNRMTFGEILAVMTVVVAVFLLGWEMLYLFKILPIRLSTR